MSANLYNQYASKICRHAGLVARVYDEFDLNDVIMGLPLGEAHAALAGRELEQLPRLGESVSINSHMQAHFFDVVGLADKELHEFTSPVLVPRKHLERLEGWRDWRTLVVYLSQSGLEPVMVFRNTPIPIKTGTFEHTDYYVADVRVICNRDQPYHWAG
jgi:hypothetical protein